ncbi:MAG: hypothetical protein IID61_11025 [SAR324 cluster bacterium]|nr:hypothetical protein [SAR324 cluster bacterium]
MSSRFNKRLGFYCLGMLFAAAAAAGCEDTSASDTCLDKLNNKKYANVAGDSSCSTYERGSAELGLAKFEFSSFISTDALTNFPSTLGLTVSGCKISGTDKLSSRSYFSEYHQHYLRSQYYTRWFYTENNRTQPLFDAEIALFAAAGEIIAQTYCEVDANLNGAISTTEIEDFTSIQVPSGSPSITSTDYIMVVDGDSVAWLIDTSGDDPTSWLCRQSPDFSSVWSRLSSASESTIETDNGTCAALVATASEISVVLSLASMPRLFPAGSTVSDIEGPFNLIDSSLQKGEDIIQDLSTIGLEEGSQIRAAIEQQMLVLDNGGTCSSAEDTINALDTLAVILENAEPAESYDDTSIDLENNNLFTQEQIASISSDSPVSCPEDVSSCSARLIYSDSDSGGDFTDLYMLANDDIAETLGLSDALLFDPDSGLLRETEAGDFDITLAELLCFQ